MPNPNRNRGPLSAFTRPSFWFVAVLALVLVGLWRGLGFVEQTQEPREDEEIARILDERGEVVEDKSGSPKISTAILGSRSETIAAVEQEAEMLLPGAQGVSDIARFWFVSDGEFYVEYMSGGEIQMVFLKVEDQGLARRALYGQAASGTWELIEGEEVLFVKPLRDLYERDSSGDWVARN